MNKLTMILILLSFLFIQCNTGGTEESIDVNNERRVRTVAVETLTMEEDTLEETIRVIGTVEAYDDAIVSSEASGRVQYIAPLGKHVEPGEVIARLDDRLLQAQYEAARVQHELAVDTYNRQQALYADSIISELQYNSIRTQRDQAKAHYEQAKKQLHDSRIEASFRGRIEERFVKSGELINPGMPVVRVVNTSRIKVTAGVPDRYAADIREGSQTTLHFNVYGNPVREGTVSFAGNVIDPDTRTYPIEIDIQNPDGILKPEMVAEVHLVRRSIDQTLVIPRTAIVRDETGTNVFVVRYEEGYPVAELTPVRTGVATGSLMQIVEGIVPGDEVVVTGSRTLNQGDRLEILQNQTSTRHALSKNTNALNR
jgi:membrane fusion protein, multidrug efflux system